jgi:hypothetical protein
MMQDRLQAGHTIPPSRSVRQAVLDPGGDRRKCKVGSETFSSKHKCGDKFALGPYWLR